MPGDIKGFTMASVEEAAELKEDGWKASDLHVHTLCSHDVLPAKPLHPRVLYDKARRMGMDYVTFTDHNNMRAYGMIDARAEGLVRGVEFSVKDPSIGHTIHMNVYDLDEDQFKELKAIAKDEKDLRALVDRTKSMGLPLVYNHPLWFKPGDRPNIKGVPDIVKMFPVVEYNLPRMRRKNEITMGLAALYGKGIVATTDTHSGTLGGVYTLAKGDTFSEYFRNVRDGKAVLAVHDMTKDDIVREVDAWIALVFSLEWISDPQAYWTGVKPIDRLIHALSGETLKGFPRLYSSARSLLYRISGTGLPAAIYQRSENSLLPEIERALRPFGKTFYTIDPGLKY